MSDSVHPLGNTLLRTPATFAAYHGNPKREAEECFICDGEITLITEDWGILVNDFPYDAVAEKHFLIVPVRHFSEEWDMTSKERASLKVAKDYLEQYNEFDCVIENLARGRTFFPHFHLHLIKWIRA